MSDMTEWLLACIAEDESVARAAIDPERPGTHWHWVNDDDSLAVPNVDTEGAYLGQGRSVDLRTVEEFPTHSVGTLPAFPLSYVEEAMTGPAQHIARQDPAHVLAVCKAHRAIVDLHDVAHHCTDGTHQKPVAPPLFAGIDPRFPVCDTLRALATIYADRPGWREEWAL